MKNVKGIVYTAMLSTLALVLGLIQIPTPFAPYLAIDGSEIIVLVAANFFGFGVMSTVVVLRSILRWAFGISTGFFIVGEIAAIISSIMLGGIFLLIKKYCLKNKLDEESNKKTFKLNNIILLVTLVLLIPFTYFAFQKEDNPWLVVGLITLYLPILIYFIFTLIKKQKSMKYSGQILTASTAILINSVVMTLLNFLVITPSNALQKPATFVTILEEFHMPMDAFVLGFILPVLPFNILKGIISVVIYFIIEKTLSKAFKAHSINA